MPITNSYPIGTPKLSDTILGTVYEDNREPATKNFNINDVLELGPTAVGPTGPAGPAGPQGPQGEPGNAAYLSYVAIVSQNGNDVPTESMVYNDTGTTTQWVRQQAGVYRLAFSSAIVPDVSSIWYSNSNNQSSTINIIEVLDESSIALVNFNQAEVLVDGFAFAPIEIRFYI